MATLVGLAVVTVPAVESARLLRAQPEGSIDDGYEGAKGYAEVARDVLAQLPPGAVVSSLQSGALGYFAAQDVQVVNLDGVVDGDAASALERGRLPDYMHERGVTHFADWPFNYFVLESHSGASRVGAPTLEPVGAARRQAGERFHITRVRYPDAP